MTVKLLKTHYGSMVLFVLAFIPIIMWLQFATIASVAASFGTLVASLGKASALSGIALYALMPVLSMRHRVIEIIFGGLDKVYILHSKAGKISFFLIMLHPLLLGAGRLLSGSNLVTIWDWWSLLILTGLVSLATLIFVTMISLYSHIKHQNWIWIHRLFGWILPIFFVHALVARSQIVKNELLLVYMIFLGLFGLSAFLYRSVFYTHFVRRYRYELSEINNLSESVVEIVLKPTAVPINFQAGQFAYLSFENPQIDSEAHPYSFSNANNGPYVRFTIKALGDDTIKIKQLFPGTTAYVEGPYGMFSYKNVRNHKQVWIAGGIGITPFLSMARSLSGKKHYDIRFYYGIESLDDAVFLQEFIDITRHIPENFSTTVVSENISGFVSVDLLKKSLQNLAEFDYMICGPPSMMKAIRQQLKQSGVEDSQIHIESFSL